MISQALTRQAHEQSKQRWEGLLGLVTKEFKLLEAWVKDNAQKQQDKLTETLREDLLDTEPKWACQEKLDLLVSLQKAWKKKLSYLNSLLQKMENEVLGALTAASQDDTDSINSCQFKIRELDGIYD